MKAEEILARAAEYGFYAAARLNTSELTVVPEYRRYCEENLCGCYGVNPACPPESGTVEEMRAGFMQYKTALILQTLVSPGDGEIFEKPALAKLRHNRMAENILSLIEGPHIWMSAGPYKGNSCMSAYCIDCQKMADAAGLKCWEHDGKYRFFSVICFND